MKYPARSSKPTQLSIFKSKSILPQNDASDLVLQHRMGLAKIAPKALFRLQNGSYFIAI
jgi:hypothetical protein